MQLKIEQSMYSTNSSIRALFSQETALGDHV